MSEKFTNTRDVVVGRNVLPSLKIPSSLITSELEGLYGSSVLAELSEILGFYEIYDKGSNFLTEGSQGDYVPSDLKFRQSASLLNKEARFLFAKPTNFWVNVPYTPDNKDSMSQANTVLQSLVDRVLKTNHMQVKLLKAAKDCFIGKRVAYLVNFNENKGTIKVDFLPSMEFVYETDPEDSERIQKFTSFYTTVDSKQKAEQRIYRKRYWMKGGFCWINEAIFDGLGSMIEEITPDRPTKFTSFPGGVIINDGLTGDLQGESEISVSCEFESWYSRLSNADMDAERQGMNPTRWTRDMDPNSTKNLSNAAGSYWDLITDSNAAEGVKGEVGILEPSMNYTKAITNTLGRIKSTMFENLDIPDVSPEALKGVVTSGKTLKAIYWGLIVRCSEKMLSWRPALEHIISLIIEGSKLYPGSARGYIMDKIPTVDYTIKVENQYPLPEDTSEEKETDLSEVNGQTMSKKAYMKKWRNLTDEEADAELEQMAKERQLLEDSFSGIPGVPSKEDEEDT